MSYQYSCILRIRFTSSASAQRPGRAAAGRARRCNRTTATGLWCVEERRIPISDKTPPSCAQVSWQVCGTCRRSRVGVPPRPWVARPVLVRTRLRWPQRRDHTRGHTRPRSPRTCTRHGGDSGLRGRARERPLRFCRVFDGRSAAGTPVSSLSSPTRHSAAVPWYGRTRPSS